MPIIDLTFEIQGTSIPLDYGYALFGAISRVVNEVHGDRRIGVHPIRGVKLQPGRLTLVPQSKLRVRMPSEEIIAYLPLAGTRIELDGSVLRVGLPHAEPLTPSPSLTSRIVTIGHVQTPEAFLPSIQRQLEEMQVQARAEFLPSPNPRFEGQPSRRIITVKARKIIGFPIQIHGLTAEESLIVQEKGLGSRRRMGCGLFVPTPRGAVSNHDPIQTPED